MQFFEITNEDKELIQIALETLEQNFDDGICDKHINNVIAPCGNCRQMLLEYCPDIKVILNDDEGKLIKVGIKDLLPFSWTPVIVE